jgi:hypothetical protein
MSNNPDILSSVRIAQRLLLGRSEGSIYGGIPPQGRGLRKLLDPDLSSPNLASWTSLSGGATSFRWQGIPSVASPDQTAGDLRTQNSNMGWDLTLTSGSLTAPSSTSSGGNGVYAYGGTWCFSHS